MRKLRARERAVLRELIRMTRTDYTYRAGRILSSMCSEPHPLAKLIFCKFLSRNAGDPFLFPSSERLEKQAIKVLAEWFSGRDVKGWVTSGGTESNITALWIAREVCDGIGGEVIVPESAHFSVIKACRLLGLKPKIVTVDQKENLDERAVKRAITGRTIAIVATAGTPGLGVIDPIEALSDLALENDLYLHVDAAFGGFILPFGEMQVKFDFALKGVKSLSVDPHKAGLIPIPCGVIMFRKQVLDGIEGFRIPYKVAGGTETLSLLGTRPASSIMALWAMLKVMGREGYAKIARECLKLTIHLYDELCSIKGIEVVRKPVINVLGFRTLNPRTDQVLLSLRRMGWGLTMYRDYIRIVLMPHVAREHVEKFLGDLKVILQ